MFNRITEELRKRKENLLEIEIEQDLASYYNKLTPGTYGICKKYNLLGDQKNISYLLRNFRRQLNIAQAMEEEERIATSHEIIEKYKKELIEKIEINEKLKKPLK